MELKVQHLSYSSISLWKQCPRKWWLRYQYGISDPPSIHLAFGTAMHQSIQTALIEGGLTENTWKKFRLNLKSAALASKLHVLSKETEEYTRMGENILKDEMVRYVANSVKISTSEQVEKKIEFYVPGVDLPVIGFIDLIDDAGHPYDIKTSKYDWAEGRAEEETQPDYYLTALDLLGDTRHGGNFSHMIVVKNANAPSAYMLDTHREGYIERVYATVQEMWKGIQNRDWEPKVVREACVDCKWKGPCYYHG